MLNLNEVILNYLTEDYRMMVPNIMVDFDLSYEESLDVGIDLLYTYFNTYGTEFIFLSLNLVSPTSAYFFPVKEEHRKDGYFETPDPIRVNVKEKPDIEFREKIKNAIGSDLLPR